MSSLRSLLLIPAAALSLAAATFPEPPNVPVAAKTSDSVVLAGGCFWGMQLVFDQLKGVTSTVVGYAGGDKKTAQYDTVSTGRTGHAESIKITYDPAQISYGTLLKVFFSVVHDPTTLNRQENDEGPQYRSAIFYSNDDQKKVSEAYIKELNDAKVYKHPIVTQVAALQGFYPAEEHHQKFAERNPNYPYIVYVDQPKSKRLKEQLPQLLKGK